MVHGGIWMMCSSSKVFKNIANATMSQEGADATFQSSRSFFPPF